MGCASSKSTATNQEVEELTKNYNNLYRKIQPIRDLVCGKLRSGNQIASEIEALLSACVLEKYPASPYNDIYHISVNDMRGMLQYQHAKLLASLNKSVSLLMKCKEFFAHIKALKPKEQMSAKNVAVMRALNEEIPQIINSDECTLLLGRTQDVVAEAKNLLAQVNKINHEERVRRYKAMSVTWKEIRNDRDKKLCEALALVKEKTGEDDLSYDRDFYGDRHWVCREERDLWKKIYPNDNSRCSWPVIKDWVCPDIEPYRDNNSECGCENCIKTYASGPSAEEIARGKEIRRREEEEKKSGGRFARNGNRYGGS